MGVDFTAQVIAQMQNVPERELVRDLTRELDKRYRLVQEQGESKVGRQFLSRYRFTHAVIQQFLYNELGSSERRLMHGDVANALEALYGGQADEIAVQLARHFEVAGDDERALAHLTRAGDDDASTPRWWRITHARWLSGRRNDLRNTSPILYTAGGH
jgi:predicted ATPase